MVKILCKKKKYCTQLNTKFTFNFKHFLPLFFIVQRDFPLWGPHSSTTTYGLLVNVHQNRLNRRNLITVPPLQGPRQFNLHVNFI